MKNLKLHTFVACYGVHQSYRLLLVFNKGICSIGPMGECVCPLVVCVVIIVAAVGQPHKCLASTVKEIKLPHPLKKNPGYVPAS